MIRRVNVGTMLAAMFYRGVDVDKIESMSYKRLKVYYEFHEVIENEFKKNLEAMKQNGG